MKSLKIYIGIAIKGLTETEWQEAVGRIEQLKKQFAEKGHEVLPFRSNSKRQAKKGTVFKWDYRQCMTCDAMVAITLKPSTGMGMEVAFCLTRRHPTRHTHNPAVVLAVAPRGNPTTPMITECDLPGFSYQEFDSWDEIPNMLEAAWKHRQRSLKAQQARKRKARRKQGSITSVATNPLDSAAETVHA